jgi:broad specificity phosphatase PhoE
MEKHIYFIRHGESNSNSDGIHRGAHSILSDVGHKQAESVAKRIIEIGIDSLISSPYTRTMQTAEEISKATGLVVEESNLFVERRRPSSLEGGTLQDPQNKKIDIEIFEGYALEDHRHSDEENLTDLRKRATAALEFLSAHPKDKICVVTHGVFVRILLCAAVMGTDFSGKEMQNFIRSFDTNNTGISHFKLQTDSFATTPKSQWVVMSWNDTNHLR